MRNMVTDRSFAPSTLGVGGLDTRAGNRLHGESIRKGIHPYGAGGVALWICSVQIAGAQTSRRYL
jgi:hypothetical protein